MKKEILPGIAFLIVFVMIMICRNAALDVRNKDYSAFLDALSKRESSGRYDAKNEYGYLGRYQMGKLALQEAGFQNADGTWTNLANGYGIYSEADFLKSKTGQEAAVRACHKKLCWYIRHYSLDTYVGQTYCGVTVTRSGLLAACHLVGVNSLRQALRENTMTYDGNHVPASEYMERFSGYDISEVWSAGT